MSRTIIKFTSPFNSNAVFDAFGKFMYRENFEFVQKNGEQYWKKGVGLLTAPQFLKLSVNNDGSYVLEAWIKFAILPGVYVGEMGTKGFVGALPKQLLKERVDKTLMAMQANVIYQIGRASCRERV